MFIGGQDLLGQNGIIGYYNNNRYGACTFDMDEFMVFDRTLTSDEVYPTAINTACWKRYRI